MEPPSPERNRSRSPPAPPPVKAEPVEDEAAGIARRTCPVCIRVFDSVKAMWGHSWVHRERRDQIHSMAPPAVGGGAFHPWRIDSMDVRDRTCHKCGKMFNTPKAMFGHLQVHYVRAPARRAKGESSSRQVAPVVEERPAVEVPEGGDGDADSPVSIDLNRPVCMEEDDKADGEDSSSSSSSSSSIDLNKVPSC